MKTRWVCAAGGMAWLLFCALNLQAQACQVLERLSEGSYRIRIDGRELYTVSEEALRNALKCKADLDAAKAEIAAKEAYINQLEGLKTKCDTAYQELKKYAEEMELILKGYRSLVADYKKLKMPVWTIEGAIGLTGSTEPALMLGMGFRKLRLYGFFQKDNSGGMVGLAWPLL